MNESLKSFVNLEKIFKSCGYNLWLVGGSVRDYLLELEIDDYDVVTDADPNMVCFILHNYDLDDSFSKYGSFKITFENVKFDLTCLRKEKEYSDSRHPNKICFVKNLKIDVKRRDFTINALYLTSTFNLIDLVGGRKDLDNRVIKTVGNPFKRIKEDPLRIIRALRFSLTYNLTIDCKLEKTILKLNYLLKKLNKNKIVQDLKKIKVKDSNKIKMTFEKYSLMWVYDYLKEE